MAEIRLERLRNLATEIRQASAQLRELSAVPEADFLADFKAVNSAKYLLVVACEASIDICNHLAAMRGGRAPQDYSDCFRVLEEMGTLNRTLADRLSRMAKLRNLLVHMYWRIDNARIYKIIREDLGDFEAYLAAVGRFLAAEL
jgi:uncharacterized protein YutE (UPF0331/DUF86 family)